MNKQEAIKKIKQLPLVNYSSMEFVEEVINIISQIHEPQTVVLPKEVAEWIEELKKSRSNLAWVWEVYPNEPKIKNWLESNTEKFMRAWLDGFEIEQEKLYTVEIPNPHVSAHTVLQKWDNIVLVDTPKNSGWRDWEMSQLTESEIKQDFEWAWQFREEVD